MIYLPSPESVAHEVKEDIAKLYHPENGVVDVFEVVKAVYSAIDRCTTQKVSITPTDSTQGVRDTAYDKIDRYLRNNLDDAGYADFSAALELVYGAEAPK